MGELDTQMVQDSGDVGIGLVAYVHDMGVRTVYMKVDAVTMKKLV